MPALVSGTMIFSLLPGYSGVQAEEAAVQPLKFDFGTAGSPVQEGYTGVNHATVYSPELGYGLSKSIASRDRGAGVSDMLRDFVLDTSSAKSYTFRVDVPNGSYGVRVYAGDSIASNKTAVTAEDITLGQLTTSSGQFGELTGTVEVSDGNLVFAISGNDTRLNGIEITPIGQSGEIAVSGIAVTGEGGADSLTTGGKLQMQADVSPGNATVPWVTWDVVNPDGSATVLASIDSKGVLTGIHPGTVKIVAAASDSSGVKGEKLITIAPSNTAPLKFDFGTTGSPVADGYVRVADNTLYTEKLGYGLNQAVNSRNRSGSSDALLSDFVLLQGTADYTFENDLPNGTYDVKVTAGDYDASNETSVTVEGVNLGRVSTSSRQFGDLSGTVEVTDRKMTFTFGGHDRRVNAVEITPKSVNDTGVSVKTLTVSGAGGADKVAENSQLQMLAEVLPVFANNRSVSWVVKTPDGGDTTLATINANGMLKALHWGNVKVVAAASDGSGVIGEKLITIETSRAIAVPEGLKLTERKLFPSASVELAWNDAQDAIGYNIYRTQAGVEEAVKIGSAQSTSFTDTTALPGLTYSYAVTTIIEGVGGVESAKSEPLTVQMFDEGEDKPAKPDGLEVTGTSRYSISLAWNGAEGAKGYYMYRSKSEAGPFAFVGAAAAGSTSYTDNDVLTDVPYYYQVEAVNEGGLSERSDVLTVPIATIYERQMEYLNRGLVAVPIEEGVYVGWRMLGTDAEDVSFNLYRDGRKLNDSPIVGSTNYLDADGTADAQYTVRAIVGGKEQSGESARVWSDSHLNIPLQKPADGVTPSGGAYTYRANDASAADLDGDGELELVLKWDPSNSKDNSNTGYTGNVYIDAYELDGTQLWRIDMGKNIRAGAHYTQFMVYDLDGDGRAEVAMRTADGTVDGEGNVIGDADVDHRDTAGRIYKGPEYLVIFDGMTGKLLAKTDYEPARGRSADWGDDSGNRSERHLAAVAYLDAERPSLIMGRGYYTRTAVAAYNWRDGELTKLWKFDTNDGNSEYRGQGNHNLSIADVDGDSRDEIVYGSMTLDHDGSPLYTTGLGHGDAMHLGDLDPNRPGLEVFGVHEYTTSPYGLALKDAATGEIIWGQHTGIDTGRGLSANIDPRYPGEQMWAIGGEWNAVTGWLFSADGQLITNNIPSTNFAIWWDGDLVRELLDHNWDGTNGVGTIGKWDYEKEEVDNLLTAEGTYSNNSTKGNAVLQADLLGDWREEAIWRTEDSTALRLYTTTDVTEHRIYTLMHDPIYRLGIAWQNTAYNQPPHTSFYLGVGMEQPPMPRIRVNEPIPAEGAVLTGPANVQTGDTFSVVYGLNGIEGPVAAQDVTIRYDEEQLDFVGFSDEALKDEVHVLDYEESPGVVRFLFVDLGADGQQSNRQLVALKFKALGEGQTSVAVAQAMTADSTGSEQTIAGSSYTVTIQAADRSGLRALIAEAQSAHEAAVEGNAVGQYPSGTKAALLTAIGVAQSVANDSGASQSRIEQAATDLAAALQTFRGSVNKPKPGDVNEDGQFTIGDLARVAAVYGAASGDEGWEQLKELDFVADGKIDIQDLAFVASRILGLTE